MNAMMKVCGVCGDKALSYNFNAVSCESCKAFFRRNALAGRQFKCPFRGQCEITSVTRRFCQKCRLQKCFDIGMCTDLIMSEEDKVRKRRKIEANRVERHTPKKKLKKIKLSSSLQSTNTSCQEATTISTSGGESSPSSSLQSNGNNSIMEEMFGEEGGTLFDSIMAASSSSPVSDEPSSSNNNNEDDAVKDVLQVLVKEEENKATSQYFNSIESILCEAIKLEYQTCSTMIGGGGTTTTTTTATSTITHSRDLNDAETAKLNELIIASRALLTPVDDELNSIVGSEDCKLRTLLQCNPRKTLEADPALVDVINLTSIVIRRLIKMAKKISSFKNMCQEDQLALLKGGCTEIMILRSAMNYDPTRQTWQIPHSQETLNLNVDVLKLAKGNIYQEHESFIKTFDPRWRSDENIVLILCAITLFTPERPRVVHRDVIKLEQTSYYYLLRRYLESIYQGCEAKSTFLKLIQKITELHRLNETLINVYLDVNPSQVEPLLLEIFDLKH